MITLELLPHMFAWLNCQSVIPCGDYYIVLWNTERPTLH